METGLKSCSLFLTGEFLSPSPTAWHPANADWISGRADQVEIRGAGTLLAAATAEEGGRAAGTKRLKMAEDVLSFDRAAQRAMD